MAYAEHCAVWKIRGRASSELEIALELDVGFPKRLRLVTIKGRPVRAAVPSSSQALILAA